MTNQCFFLRHPTQNHICQPHGGKVIKIHPLGTMNVCTQRQSIQKLFSYQSLNQSGGSTNTVIPNIILRTWQCCLKLWFQEILQVDKPYTQTILIQI